MSRGYINEKIKVEGLKRKKRRIRLKAKNQNEAAIEKFVAQSSKSAKYAKTTVRKRDTSASADPVRKLEGANATVGANLGQTTSGVSATQSNQIGNGSNNNSSQAVGAASSSNYQTAGANGASGASGASASGQAAAADQASNKP